MDETREKILTNIQKASLSQADVTLWKEIIEKIPDNLLPLPLEFIEKFPEHIPYLNKNLKEKVEYLEKGDVESLTKVFENQKEFIQSLAPSFKLDI